MTSNSEQIVQQVQRDFQTLLAYVSGPEAQSQTAYTVELTLFRRLLALGAGLLRLFFVTRAAVRPSEPITSADGTRLAYRDRRPITYYSVFGKVQFERHYFTAPGQGGCCPLDGAEAHSEERSGGDRAVYHRALSAHPAPDRRGVAVRRTTTSATDEGTSDANRERSACHTRG